jgi:hypothetical protein
MEIKFTKATRKSVPLLISIAGTSGSGKTYSALLLAAGIAGPGGRVGFIDTENGRGEMYADSPGIVRALPAGYDYVRFDPPFSPERYTEHIALAEKSGITVCVIDSGTHEWEGIGGVLESAEKAEERKGRFGKWSDPKMRHKRFMYHCLTSSMHMIFCLRARDKVKMFKRGDAIVLDAGQDTSNSEIAEKDLIVPLGLQPVCEKNFVFEMLLSLQLDERTHFAGPIKVPEPLIPLFTGKRLLAKADGEAIRQWNETGSALADNEQISKRARATAEEGMAAYSEFWKSLTPEQRKALAAAHGENKKIAAKADKDQLPDPMSVDPDTRIDHDGKSYVNKEVEPGVIAWVEAA